MMTNSLILSYSGYPESQNEPHDDDYGIMTEWKPTQDETEESIIDTQSFVVEDFMDQHAKAYSERMGLHNSLQHCIICITDIFQEYALNGVFYKYDYDSDDEWLVIDIDSEGSL